MALLGFVLGIAGSGCAAQDRYLRIWKEKAGAENVSQFSLMEQSTNQQWFARLVNPGAMPAGTVFPLTDRFDFVLVSRQQQWPGLLKATSLTANEASPDLSAGVVVGLIARVGESRHDRWPVMVQSVRQRGGVAFLYGVFREGFYRPLSVPAYMHLVYVRDVDTFLGLKLNQMMYGFNVEIDDLNAAGIR
ncbi:MAG TPA: hypothetical protein VNT79_11385 [Phycisphaerae bacterium]|nr:hypothetical protein [Phycisphaerae bacterium]